jgi:hypothetical protein
LAKNHSLDKTLLLAVAVLPLLAGSFFTAFAQIGGSPTKASLGVPFTLAPGETAEVEDSDIYVKFLNVTEDSRCPSDVVCVWAGQVSVSINLLTSDSDLGTFTLTLGAASNTSMAERVVEGFRIKLTDVQPYPVSTHQIALSEYRASLAISKEDGGSATARSVLVMALGRGDLDPTITKFISSWSVEKQSGVAIFVTRNNESNGDSSQFRKIAEFLPTPTECSHAGAECIDGQITSLHGIDGGIDQEGGTIHMERDSKTLYVSFKEGLPGLAGDTGSVKEYALDVHKFREVTKPQVPQDGNATVITMEEGQREGPLLVQKIYPDRIEGLNYPEYPIAMDKGLPITLHIGEKASNGCTVSLTLIKIDSGVATFQKRIEEDRPCPICWLQSELMAGGR